MSIFQLFLKLFCQPQPPHLPPPLAQSNGHSSSGFGDAKTFGFFRKLPSVERSMTPNPEIPEIPWLLDEVHEGLGNFFDILARTPPFVRCWIQIEQVSPIFTICIYLSHDVAYIPWYWNHMKSRPPITSIFSASPQIRHPNLPDSDLHRVLWGNASLYDVVLDVKIDP